MNIRFEMNRYYFRDHIHNPFKIHQNNNRHLKSSIKRGDRVIKFRVNQGGSEIGRFGIEICRHRTHNLYKHFKS